MKKPIDLELMPTFEPIRSPKFKDPNRQNGFPIARARRLKQRSNDKRLLQRGTR